ncbi:MAG: FAD-dependent monooxygenase [Casimicrobiaceae bacterium]
MNRRYDALIIGAGPAGSTAALLLARAGWQVGIVEKESFPRRKVCGEFVSATTWPLLNAMGIGTALQAIAGPAVQRVGAYVGDRVVTARLPAPPAAVDFPGCALGREHLDAALLKRAIDAGAELWQPWTLDAFESGVGDARCAIVARGSRRAMTLRCSVVIAAHGAWESGPLPTQASHARPRDRDLLGFKAHFRNGALPADLMPLIAFPGGYGGLVNSGDGRLSLSCCVRRDALTAIRARHPRLRAGDTVLAHIAATCAGAGAALAGATLDGAWLAAGPLRTGIRSFGTDRIIAVGNAAAEAHPIVAEGISMAIQSAHLACSELLACGRINPGDIELNAVRRRYERAWRRNFSVRLHAAACFAHLFMRPASAAITIRALQGFPSLLKLGAHWSGKNSTLRATRPLIAADIFQ